MKTTTPTTETVARAAAKAAQMWGTYEVSPISSDLPHLFMVQHKEDALRGYLVDTRRATCQCPAFEKDGDCKHRHFQHEWAEVEAGELATQDPATIA